MQLILVSCGSLKREREKKIEIKVHFLISTQKFKKDTLKKNEPKGNYTRVCKAESVSEAAEEVDVSVKVIRTFCCEGK